MTCHLAVWLPAFDDHTPHTVTHTHTHTCATAHRRSCIPHTAAFFLHFCHRVFVNSSRRFHAHPPHQVPGINILSFQTGSAVSKFPADIRFKGILLSHSWELSPSSHSRGQTLCQPLFHITGEVTLPKPKSLLCQKEPNSFRSLIEIKTKALRWLTKPGTTHPSLSVTSNQSPFAPAALTLLTSPAPVYLPFPWPGPVSP